MLSTLSIFSIVLVACFCDNASDEVMQKIFSGMAGPVKDIVEDCLQERSLKLTDLKDYERTDDTPENQLCFMKCFYDGLLIFDEDGRVNMDLLKESPMIIQLDKDKYTKLESCLKEVGMIKTCNDMKKFQHCWQFLDVNN